MSQRSARQPSAGDLAVTAPRSPAAGAARVAVFLRPGDSPQLMILPPGAAAPEGAALAWLVAATESDAALLKHCVPEPR